MNQPYIGSTKINKLYKGSELWCNWSSSGGGDTPVEPSKGFVTDSLMICCDAYGKTSSDTFDGFYDSINGKKFNINSGSAKYETNCVNINGGHLVYGNGVNEYGSILKMGLKDSTFELVFKSGSYRSGWKSILTMGVYTNGPFSIKSNINAYGGNKLVFLMNGGQVSRKAIKCLDKTKFWNHLVISIGNDGETYSVAKIYVNGEYFGEHTIYTNEGNTNAFSSGLYFGYSGANDVPLMSIGSFRYYHKALTEAEVIQNYNHEQSINRITTLNFPALDDSYESGDPPITDGPGEMSKGGVTSE